MTILICLQHQLQIPLIFQLDRKEIIMEQEIVMEMEVKEAMIQAVNKAWLLILHRFHLTHRSRLLLEIYLMMLLSTI